MGWWLSLECGFGSARPIAGSNFAIKGRYRGEISIRLKRCTAPCVVDIVNHYLCCRARFGITILKHVVRLHHCMEKEKANSTIIIMSRTRCGYEKDISRRCFGKIVVFPPIEVTVFVWILFWGTGNLASWNISTCYRIFQPQIPGVDRNSKNIQLSAPPPMDPLSPIIC